MPEDIALQCALIMGSDKYSTFEQAVAAEPFLKQAMADYDISLSTMRRQMLKADHLLKKCHTTHPMQELSPEHKLLRKILAQQYLKIFKEFPQFLQQLVGIDMKTVVLNSATLKSQRWGHRGFKDEAELVTESRHVKKQIVLKYYAGVNAIMGAVFIKFVTGTTELRGKEEAGDYKVCAYLGVGVWSSGGRGW